MTIRQASVALFLAVTALSTASAVEGFRLHSFERRQLTDQFLCEGATCADLNRDGQPDLIAGPYWYAGPDFTDRAEVYPPTPFSIDGYSDNHFAFTYDFNGDGWLDIFIIGFPGKEAFWFENPQGQLGHWQRHLAFATVDNESPLFVDITGDDRPELVFHTGGRWGYAKFNPTRPTQPWQFHAISDNRGYDLFNHGLGVGDVDGDGRPDLVEKAGWWEQPADAGTGWKFHPVPFSAAGGAQMLVYDVDGDGDNDVITSKAAHAYGLAWFEQLPGGEFHEHLIMGEQPGENEYGVAFSQLHALALADIDGDGVQDIVTGKRFWAHQGHDPGERDPAVLYWFKTVRTKDDVRFIPHLIDGNSGVGTQVVVGDLNGDPWPDIVVGNKKGTFAFLQHVELVDEAAWSAAQPKPLEPASPPATSLDGFAPIDAEGRPVNLDFESGDTRGWTATGKSFEGQPIWGDTVHARRGDMVSGHHGDRWIGGYELAGDGPQGTFTSPTFPVTHPWAVMYVGGGSSRATRAEIVRADSGQVVFDASGRDNEQMYPVTVDLREHLGESAFVRLVDESSAGWGHVNFDHFRFYDEKPQISVLEAKVLRPDEYPHAGLSPLQAVQEMIVPEGFRVNAFAGEPDVQQPIAMALDDRGRIWIAEAFEYPQRAEKGKGRDRIIILEDADGDGVFDNRKVFADGLNLVSGLEVGFGGVWVGAAPYLMFIPDRNGDDIPDGEPEILLDGWGYQDTHETLNTFCWGPDGWLYGCHGVFTHSRVGKPGTPWPKRVPIDAGIWRYHPTRREFEVFAHGTSNPWGIDFDDHGQAVATTCVIPHLFHIIQGGRYHRQAGEHFQPYTYDDISTIADHLHFLGDTPHSGNQKSDTVGGGHAHAGAMIYLGGAWPDEYRRRILMNNIHGQRLNADILAPRGSGLVGSHGPDFLLTQDRASQMLNMRYGPDGQVYVIDWYDMQACHDKASSAHDRSNGRVYKVTYGEPRPVAVSLDERSDAQLAELVLDQNDWYVRHARRILQERAVERTLDAGVRKRLAEIAASHPDDTRRLRAAWALHVTEGIEPVLRDKLLADESPYVRGWLIQLAMEAAVADRELLAHFATMARDDSSPVVRLYLASALQRVPPDQRWDILASLVAHSEDANDHNLPLMYWYAAEPLAEVEPARALVFGLSCGKSIPLLRDFMLRRLGEGGSPAATAVLVDALDRSTDDAERLSLLRAIRHALTGKRQAAPPSSWSSAYAKATTSKNDNVRTQATALGVTFGDAAAMAEFRGLVASQAAALEDRREALRTLLAIQDPQLVGTLQQLIDDPSLRDVALSGLAAYDDPNTPRTILAAYASLTHDEKLRALATLASRPAYGVALLEAVADGRLAKADLSADLVRQLSNLEDKRVAQLLADLWGTVRSTAEDKAQLIAQYRELLAGPTADEADVELGRAVFVKTCQQCHTLYGVGEHIGPDLTGSNRADVEYLLSNIVDPAALISKEYQTSIVVTDSGRVLTGIVTTEDDDSLTLRTTTETLVVPKDEIEERQLSPTSMMPDNQLALFAPREIVSLVAYLQSKSQTPVLATVDNEALLFNGRDLTGWQGEEGLWSVENGEIVGRTAGLDHNSFLVSDLAAEDFELSFDVRLVDNVGNSGVQFRSRPIDGFKEVAGYQADIGADWWGKLYEEHGRELLWDQPGDRHVKPGEWNHYVIRAQGSRIQTWLNGQLCVDLDDPSGARRGIFALQLHAGGPTEVRFKNLKLEVLAAE